MFLSFAWTTKEFLAGIKTVTRRDWKERTMRTWQKAWDEGRLIHDAYDRLPIWKGRKIGQFRLTARPYWESLKDMPVEDLKAEGFGDRFRNVMEYIRFVRQDPNKVMAVIRFEKMD